MADRICSIEGCGKPHHARGLCPKHYMRDKAIRQDAEECLYPDCHSPHYARGYCGKHYQRLRRWADASIERKYDATGKAAGYWGIHDRLYSRRGSASGHLCTACGGRAAHWAYDYTDPRPLFSEEGMPYSQDLSRYQPMCVSCHRFFDREHAARG